MCEEKDEGIENLEQAVAQTDVPPLHPGPFKWFPDPYDDELRYRAIYRHFAEQDKVVNLWNLPVCDGVYYASNRDGVLILLTADDYVCFYEGTDVSQDADMFDRYVNDPYTLFIDRVLTEEEYGEIKAEHQLVRENVRHRKAALERREAVSQLRVELMAEHLQDFQAVKGFLESPDVSTKEIESFAKQLVAVRKRIAKVEAFGEQAVFNRAKKARLKVLELVVEAAVAQKPIQPVELFGGMVLGFEDVRYTTQEELDLYLGQLYRLLRSTEASTTPEELVLLPQYLHQEA